MKPDLRSALLFYDNARDFVSSSGFRHEGEWHRFVRFSDFEETDLLRESAWVVLCSGFRESTVRRVFNHVSLCFCDWESAAAIVAADRVCCKTAMASFGNSAKLHAIFTIARLINEKGFDAIKAEILADPLSALRRFPFIGPVTGFHLAKNLGLDIAKPDRHLVRASEHFGFFTPESLCAAIAQACGDPVKVVDIVIWRFLASSSVSVQQRDRVRRVKNTALALQTGGF